MSAKAFADVRLPDGDGLGEPVSVIITDDRISEITPAPAGSAVDEVIDGNGRTLLPGLIDAHAHLALRSNLDDLAANGVTTAVDMASWPTERTDALRAESGTCRMISAGVPFIGPGGTHATFGMPSYAIVTDPDEAAAGVRRRLADGSDFIKIVTEPAGAGGPSPEVVAAIITAAHQQGAQVVTHASHIDAFRLCVDASADIITHVPNGTAVDDDLARSTPAAIPTLTVSETLTTAMPRPGTSYQAARASVTALHRAGVTIAAGTDAVDAPGVPFSIPHGASLHHELELLVAAGLSPVEALNAATTTAASLFGLTDRGAVQVGLLADLILVDGDPTQDITATRTIAGVWIGGERIR